MAIKLNGDNVGRGSTTLLTVGDHEAAFQSGVDVGISGALNLGSDLNITGNINIAGALNYTETNKTETNLFIEDKTIMVASGTQDAATKVLTDGAGLLFGSGAHGEGFSAVLYQRSLNSNDGGIVFKVDDTTEMAVDNAAVRLDTLAELTADAGVTVDGVLIKDNDIAFPADASTIGSSTTVDLLTFNANDVQVKSGKKVLVDTIDESTSATGVTIDGVLLKDNDIVFPANASTIGSNGTADLLTFNANSVQVKAAKDLLVDEILESTADGGVTIDGVLLKDNDIVVPDGSTIGSATTAGAMSISAQGTVALTKNFSVAEMADFARDVSVTGALDVAKNAVFDEMVQVGRDLLVTGAADIAGALVVDKNATIKELLTVGRDLNVSGNVHVGEELLGPVDGNLNIKSDGNIDFFLDADNDGTALFRIHDGGGNARATFEENGNLTLSGDLKGAGTFEIQDSNGDARVSMVDGGDTILHADGGTAGLTLAADNSLVTIAGDLTVSGGDIELASGATLKNDAAGPDKLILSESRIVVSGALDVTSAATFDNTATVKSNLTLGTGSLGNIFLGSGRGAIRQGVNSVGVAGTGGAKATDLTIASTTLALTGAVQTSNGIHINPADAANGAVLQFNNKITVNGSEGVFSISGSGAGSHAGETSTNVLLRLPEAAAAQAGEFVTYSDVRLKTDIVEMNDSQTLDMVMSMNPVSYNLKQGGKRQIGFLAQEMAELYPEVCLLDRETGEGIGIDYSRLTSVLAAALQAQQRQIESLKKAFVTIKK